jgi:hypothetical protein
MQLLILDCAQLTAKGCQQVIKLALAHSFVCTAAATCLRMQSLMFLWTLQLTKFAVLYSIGSVLSIGRYAGSS